MRLRPFMKMPASREVKDRAGPGGTWVALEKLHGAQLVVGVRGVREGVVRFGKRKAWLADDEPFFGWQLLRAELTDSALRVARAVGGEGRDVYLYGELFGGRYPHPDVPRCPGWRPCRPASGMRRTCGGRCSTCSWPARKKTKACCWPITRWRRWPTRRDC